jgi:hypothetical protein
MAKGSHDNKGTKKSKDQITSSSSPTTATKGSNNRGKLEKLTNIEVVIDESDGDGDESKSAKDSENEESEEEKNNEANAKQLADKIVYR